MLSSIVRDRRVGCNFWIINSLGVVATCTSAVAGGAAVMTTGHRILLPWKIHMTIKIGRHMQARITMTVTKVPVTT